MFKVVVINGKPRSGKDTFVDACDSICGVYVDSASTVDFVKDIAAQCGWDGSKTAKNRQFLSDLKDLLTKWDDVPFRDVSKAITIAQHEFEEYYWTPNEQDEELGLFFVHSREPEDIQRWVDTYDAVTLKIERPTLEQEQHNKDQ